MKNNFLNKKWKQTK